MRVERPPEKHPEQLAGALRPVLQRLLELREAILVVLLQRPHAGMRAAERLAVRGKDQHIGGEFTVAGDRVEEQPQRVALGVDRPDRDVGRDGGEQHVAGDEHVRAFGIQREMLGCVAMADDGAPGVSADAQLVVLDDAPVRKRELGH